MYNPNNGVKIKEALENSKPLLSAYLYLKEITKNYPEVKVYIFGGAIRDLSINICFNRNVNIRDFDVLLDIPNKSNLKIDDLINKKGSIEIDYFNIDNFLFNNGDRDIDNLVNDVDLTINSGFYSIRSGNFYYSDQFFNDLKHKNIELLLDGATCRDNLRGNWRVFSKVLFLNHKLGFTIGPKTIEALIENNPPEILSSNFDKILKVGKEKYNLNEDQATDLSLKFFNANHTFYI